MPLCVGRLSSLSSASERGGVGTEPRREVEGLDGLGGLSGQSERSTWFVPFCCQVLCCLV